MADILTDVDDDGVAVITLNRPDKRNAVKMAMWAELGALFRDFGADSEVRVIILTGAGGCFSAGADISEFSDKRGAGDTGDEYDDIGDVCTRSILEAPKPTIAAIDGFCVGGGLGLALTCDFRIARNDAQLGIPAARLGIVYGPLDTRLLIDAVGVSAAKRILFTAERVDAEAAFRMGLVDELTDDDALTGARVLARKMCGNAPLSIAGAKRIVRGLTESDERLSEVAGRLREQAIGSSDYQEGVRAFAEKRSPRFTGS